MCLEMNVSNILKNQISNSFAPPLLTVEVALSLADLLLRSIIANFKTAQANVSQSL